MIDPANYTYLWTDHDINYLFVSCYLFEEFKDGGLVEVDADNGIVKKIK